MCFAAAALSGVLPAFAAEMWTPETGEMSLEELPRDTPEAHRRHALGLLGAGELSGGVPELRELMAADPQAPWVPDARLAIGRSMVAAGHYGEAFDEFQAIVDGYADTAAARFAAEERYTAARLLSRQDMTAGAELYDRLIGSEKEAAGQVWATKEKADAYFRAGRFPEAQLEYRSISSIYPRSEWTSYAYYMYAQCGWRAAEWLDQGLDKVQTAEANLRDFAQDHPNDVHAAEARRLAGEARERRAALNWSIALYYVDVERKPWASVNYLRYIIAEFPDTKPEEWAKEELSRVKTELRAPLRGTIRTIELPGVSRGPGDA